ncbi:FimV/HubP family polar landmark protein [Comamonas sp.]
MHRWKLSALAAAVIVSAALSPTDAAALTLGTLTVQSSLGEKLRAEISLPQATAAEINSLVAQVATPEVFNAQGMNYSTAANAISVEVHRNADGSAILRLTSNTPLYDPFVDLVLQTQWNAGQLVRSYTLLLDSPKSERPAPAPTVAPQVKPAPASVTGRTYASRPAAPRPNAARRSLGATPDGEVRVRRGDTASHIANANRPAGVSLDQMLVAMLRSNPSAFVNGNMNRLRAGAVLQMPSREQALETSAGEARQIVAAQSRDFNAYRRSLAAKAPKATVQTAGRSASGQVQTQVAESRSAADAPDKLTLSKGSMQNAAAEAQLAAQKQSAEQDNRLSELQRNLAELNELAQSTASSPPVTTDAAPAENAAAPQAAAGSAATPSAPGLEVTSPSLATATENAQNATEADNTTASADTPAAETVASATTPDAAAQAAPSSSTSAADAPASEAPAAAPASAATPAATTAENSSAADASGQPAQEANTSNLWLPIGAGLAVLLGLLGYGAWKRRRDTEATAASDPADAKPGDTAPEQMDRTQPEDEALPAQEAAAVAALGGAAAQEPATDPMAQAEAHLAYGRDIQAEEVLKEALRHDPTQLAYHVKLAEIYVKRQDIPSLEDTARAMQAVSASDDPQWLRVVEMGRDLAPANPYFAAQTVDGVAGKAMTTSAFAAALDSARADSQTSEASAPNTSPADTADTKQIPDFDFDLDLAAPSPGAPSVTAGQAAAATPAAPDATPLPSEDKPAANTNANTDTPESSHADNDLQGLSDLGLNVADFDIPEVTAQEQPAASASAQAAPASTKAPDEGNKLSADAQQAQPSASPDEAVAASSGDFDLGSLDLDLGESPAPAAPAKPVHNLMDDPLSTKLDLAQEFNAIGDSEGARTLIEEVLAEAGGPIKERAQKMLSELD